MRYSPRPAQAATQARMVDNPYQLVALRMGAGKTAATLSAIDELMFDRFDISRTLVVAPKRVAELVWDAEVAKWDHLGGLRVSKVLGTAKQRSMALIEDANIFVINRENFVWLVEMIEATGHDWPFDCVVIDENWGFKDRSSQSWRALKRMRDQIKRLYILTGTPDPNGDLLDLWPQISILDGGRRLGTGITKYRDQWYLPDKRNGTTIFSWKLKPGAREEIQKRVRDVMVSIDRKSTRLNSSH